MPSSDSPSASRLPTLPAPHNIEAERGVLGAMLLDNELIDELLHIVRSDDFHQDSHRAIFEGMCELHEAGQPVDLTLLADLLRRRGRLEDIGGPAYLAALEQGTLSSGAAPELAGIVSSKATLRRLMAAADSILRDASEERRDVEEAIDRAEQLILGLSQEARSSSFRPTSELMEESLEQIASFIAARGDVAGLSTGFQDLDRILGGLQPNDLLILAARPSIGKTAFALNIATNVALGSGRPVGVFSLEMGAEQLNLRLLCSHARVPGHVVRRGSIDPPALEKLHRAAADIAKAPIYIDDSAGLNLIQVRSRARRLKAKHDNLGLIVVDYLQLMSGPESKKRDANRQQEVSDISRGLKALARELNVPVLALSQLSRNIEQRSKAKEAARPMLSDLRESGAIEQDADVVMFVHRERLETMKDAEGKPMHQVRAQPIETEIIVAKHRNGPTGTAKLLFLPDFTLFTTLARGA